MYRFIKCAVNEDITVFSLYAENKACTNTCADATNTKSCTNSKCSNTSCNNNTRCQR